MFQFEPDPNLGRRSQIFQIWIRPVEPPTAHFALRLALFEFDKLVRQGLSQEELRALAQLRVQEREPPDQDQGRGTGLRHRQPVLRHPRLQPLRQGGPRQADRGGREQGHPEAPSSRETSEIVVVAKDCEALRKKLIANEPSPMTYNSPKPKEITDEDEVVGRFKIDVAPEAVKIVPVDTVFE